MTVLDLLAESGGPTQSAHLEKIMIVNISLADQRSNASHIFDLTEFVKTPNFTKLPTVRAGDTVYVPDLSASNWNQFMDSIKDVVSIVSIVAITGGL
jgi:protein involved in polysaccharide export with SLBB domain